MARPHHGAACPPRPPRRRRLGPLGGLVLPPRATPSPTGRGGDGRAAPRRPRLARWHRPGRTRPPTTRAAENGRGPRVTAAVAPVGSTRTATDCPPFAWSALSIAR